MIKYYLFILISTKDIAIVDLGARRLVTYDIHLTTSHYICVIKKCVSLTLYVNTHMCTQYPIGDPNGGQFVTKL